MKIRSRSLRALSAGSLFLLAGLAPLAPALAFTPSPPAAPVETPAVPAEAPAASRPAIAIVDGKEIPVPAIPMGDAATIAKILEEGKNNNQVMEHLRHLTKEIGPRLTGSTRLETANKWAKAQYDLWGLSNARLEEWGTIATRFDRGPSRATVVLRDEREKDGQKVTEYKKVRDMQISSPAWTKGTQGLVRAEVVKAPTTDEEYAAVRESLKGKWILLPAEPAVGMRGVRSRLSTSIEARAEARKEVAEGKKKQEEIALPQRLIFDGVAGFISTTRDERVWTGGAPGWKERPLSEIADDIHIVVRLSDYDCINSRLADKEPVEIEVDLQHTLTQGPIPCFNTIAEIKGSEKPEEVVIVSAHLDSWDGPGSQGATDNGTGSAVVLEAARILAASGAKPKRTIRFINWTGEEQGLLGARGYVKLHKEEILKTVSACFVDDGGTNYQGGLPAAENQVDYLAAATAPVNNVFYDEVDKKYLNVNVRNTGKNIETHGSSDHAAFNQIGVPGFFWDEVGRADYGFGWHTQNDTYELAIETYLRQSSTCMAVTAFNLACAPDLLPRVVKEEKKD
ncbi:MAG: M20/M25/M40 family metallo-hydrolase [Tepidisphaera sp.]